VDFVVSFVTSGTNIISEEPLADAIKDLEELGAKALLVNCRKPEELTPAVKVLSQTATVPFGAYANGIGESDVEKLGWRFDTNTNRPLELYMTEVQKWVDM